MIEWRQNGTVWEAWKSGKGDFSMLLGNLSLQRFGAHTHWAWEQESFIVMSPGCLDEVRAKQKELFKDRKGVR